MRRNRTAAAVMALTLILAGCGTAAPARPAAQAPAETAAAAEAGAEKEETGAAEEGAKQAGTGAEAGAGKQENASGAQAAENGKPAAEAAEGTGTGTEPAAEPDGTPEEAALTEEEASPSEEEHSEYYNMFRYAFRDQTMPEYDDCPWIPVRPEAPRKPYASVTQDNLQGRWVRRYKEEKGTVEVEDILTVNGNTGRIECYKNGERYVVWNGEGELTIEDRSYRGVCPELDLVEYHPEDDTVLYYCTIYVRRVEDDKFYDGGQLDYWYREEPEDPSDQYLYDTVTLDALQGVWYSEYEDSAGLYQVVLNVEGDRASIFETVGGRISSTWNGEGPCSLKLESYLPGRHVPELLIGMENGPAGTGQAGIYISRVDEDRFYDAGFDRWYVRIYDDCNCGEEEEWEGNRVFTIYGGNVRETAAGFLLKPAEEDAEELLLDADTVLVNPETLSSWKQGDGAVEWMKRLASEEPGDVGPSGVYDADVTGNHIDRIYGLYWWD